MAATGREVSNLESNSFKVYVYKIVPCAKKFGHDWSECPFAHEGEKATRRCPALYRYSSIVCPDTRQSKTCPRGDVCPYSHSIFEYWMHPSRFRAQLCSFGTECNRRICFFAHTQEQLRIPSEPVVADALASRAPYLQGRVSPDTRYALYPNEVPQLASVQGERMLTARDQHMQQQQQQQMLVQADMPGMQMVYVPAGAAQGAALAQGYGQMTGLPGTAQQWAAVGAGSSSMVLVPAGQAAGGGGLGYYAVQPGAAAVAAGQSSQEYSSGMLVAPGVQLLGGYGSAQHVQLVAAMPADGSMQQYAAVHAGGVQGAQVAYAPVFAAPGGGMTLQQWGVQEQQRAPPPPHALLPGMVVPLQQQQQQRRLSQQHVQQPHLQQLQLVGPASTGDLAAARVSARQQQEGGTYIITPSGQLAPSGGQLEAPYAVMAAGPTGFLQQQACSSMPGSSQGAAEQGAAVPCPPGVDGIAQQMAGWGIQ